MPDQLNCINFAIVPRTPRLSPQEAGAVAAAIQQQIQMHFAPVWNITGTVTPIPNPQPGFVPIFVYDNIQHPGLSGFHTTQAGNLPYAVVQYGPTWSLAASHECLEILVDPGVSRTWPSLLPGQNRTVNFILEVCDPCQDFRFSYQVGPFHVSDFCTPQYYGDQVQPGMVLSFSRAITAPKEILPGGTLGWVDVNGHAYQAVNNGGNISTRDLGPFQPGPQAAREFLNGFDRRFAKLSHGGGAKHAKLVAARQKEAAAMSARYLEEFEDDLSRRVPKPKGARPARARRSTK